MKKVLFWLALSLSLLALPAALGEAADITPRCVLSFPSGSTGHYALREDSYLTYYSGRYLEVTAPPDAPCYGLFLHFSGDEAPYGVEEMNEAGEWVRVTGDDRLYANAYLPLPGLAHFRIVPEGGGPLQIARLHLLGKGELPPWVQDWQPFEGQADLLVLSAHADDELLFFGGVIPYYRGQLQKKVIVCYLTRQTPARRNELLDGLWACGVREYPVMGAFRDAKNTSLEDSYSLWGKEKVLDHVTRLLRRFRPQVVVTHDLKGEYGHGNHKVCADAAIRAFALAAEESRPDLGAPWQVQKLYLHLYRENALVMDWRKPLSAFEGRTALEVAKAAFKCHASQRNNGLIVQDDGDYANNRFGLYASQVGLDTEKTDLFENLP